MVRAVGMVAGLVAAGLVGGCGRGLPTYPAMSDRDALAVIAERQSTVSSLSAECDLELVDPNGQAVSLDGVLVARLPGKVRLRAWKFGQAVFDLTLADGKGWVLAPDHGAGGQRIDADNMPAVRVSEAMDLLGPSYFRSAEPQGGDGEVLLARGAAVGRADVVCEVDRLTLTPRRFVVGDGSELVLDRYAVVDGLVWPMRIRLRSPSGELTVRIHELEINGELPAGAFVPPGAATPLP